MTKQVYTNCIMYARRWKYVKEMYVGSETPLYVTQSLELEKFMS